MSELADSDSTQTTAMGQFEGGMDAGGQFIATSHNSEAIERCSKENTLVLYRKSHLEPTLVRPVSEMQISGDLVNALIRGDVEPF